MQTTLVTATENLPESKFHWKMTLKSLYARHAFSALFLLKTCLVVQILASGALPPPQTVIEFEHG